MSKAAAITLAAGLVGGCIAIGLALVMVAVIEDVLPLVFGNDVKFLIGFVFGMSGCLVGSGIAERT